MTEDRRPNDDDTERPSLADQRGVDSVYAAAEDSHLLADAVVEAIDPGVRALDVGTGSGYVAQTLVEAGASVVGTDLNPIACRRAAEAGVPVVRGNLLDPIKTGAIDIVAFNPPYLPTKVDDEWDDWMEHALSGGETGRAVIEPFLDDVGRVLSPDGVVFLLVSSLTNIREVRAYARECELDSAVVAEASFPFERLVVLRLARQSDSRSS